ncbi:hypothetical protein V1264_018589 [Littorina saxatilis]|uniref:Uncharacterized protein n=3 Tax=Littorina saxatilis TaxID=31220 RepID=A0AAN9BE11_9CAEN
MARQEEFTTLGAHIVIVSFGLYEGAVKWLKDTKCPFQMLIDSKRQMYQEFGLKRSAFKVWSVECMVYYGEQMRAGKKLPSPYENVHDDVNQMGGDFIVSDKGKLVLCYPSQASTDRPAVNSLLQVLKAGSNSPRTSQLMQADST